MELLSQYKNQILGLEQSVKAKEEQSETERGELRER
jgi:hypothetical protein